MAESPSMALDQRIRMYEEKFARVVFPLRPSHYDTKSVLDLLLHHDHFMNICRLAFGPISASALSAPAPSGPTPQHSAQRSRQHGVRRDAGVYWMDIGNTSPHSKEAGMIHQFLAPGGTFHAIMEHLSVPSPGFHAALRRQWKDAIDLGQGASGASRTGPSTDARQAQQRFTTDSFAMDGVTTRWFDLPIALVCPFSRQLVSESRETDLTSLPSDRVPPLLLVPFWSPPVVTRPEPSTKQHQNSVPCTMLAYFLFRMMHFISLRCKSEEREILSDVHRTLWTSASADRSKPLPGRVLQKLRVASRTIGSWLSHILDDPDLKRSKSFDFSLRLLLEYVDYYCTQSLSTRAALHAPLFRSLEDMPWDTSLTMAHVLIHGPLSMLLRRLQPVPCEMQRTAIQDTESVAALTALVPYLAEITTRFAEGAVQVSKGASAGNVDLFGSSSSLRVASRPLQLAQLPNESIHTPLASSEIIRCDRTLYKYGLTALRYATLSYPRIHMCRHTHFEGLLRLWRSMLQGSLQVSSAAATSGMDSNNNNRSPIHAASAAGGSAAVVRHFEAFVYILGDVLSLLSNSDCVEVLTADGAGVLLDALRVYREDSVVRVLSEISRLLQDNIAPCAAKVGGRHPLPRSTPTGANGAGSPLIDAVLGFMALNWSRADGSVQLLDPHGPELTALAGKAAMALWRCGDANLRPAASNGPCGPVMPILMQCAETLLAAMPAAAAVAQKLRDEFTNAPQIGRTAHEAIHEGVAVEANSLPQVSEAAVIARRSGVLPTNERMQYLSGERNSCSRHPVDLPHDLRFVTYRSTRAGATAQGPIGAAALWTAGGPAGVSSSDECPPLVAATLLLDDIAELAQTLWYWRLVPRCHRGHALWLVDSANDVVCSQHHAAPALWECHSCNVHFCNQCKPTPTPAGGRGTYSPQTPKEAGRFVCDACHVVFPSASGNVGYLLELDQEGTEEDAATATKVVLFHCSQCASRPFRKITTRILAAYSTWWNVLLAVILFMIVRRILF